MGGADWKEEGWKLQHVAGSLAGFGLAQWHEAAGHSFFMKVVGKEMSALQGKEI